MDDIFISYVAQDKDFATVLIERLRENGLKVIDGRLGLGDSLSNKVSKGLQQATYVMLILSSTFFAKSWPRYEFEEIDRLDKEFESKTKLLPVWHEIDRQSVAYYA
ncbi:TIR domain-containing protein, partial [Candidatus Saccharibacteria bacterium]|nr:TIR domain-containing protein [Candidatus Saccharibacteria bacterium]